MTKLVEVPGTVVPGVRLLRRVSEPQQSASMSDVSRNRYISDEQPDSGSLGRMYDRLSAQAGRFVQRRAPSSQGSFMRQPMGVGRKR